MNVKGHRWPLFGKKRGTFFAVTTCWMILCKGTVAAEVGRVSSLYILFFLPNSCPTDSSFQKKGRRKKKNQSCPRHSVMTQRKAPCSVYLQFVQEFGSKTPRPQTPSWQLLTHTPVFGLSLFCCCWLLDQICDATQHKEYNGFQFFLRNRPDPRPRGCYAINLFAAPSARCACALLSGGMLAAGAGWFDCGDAAVVGEAGAIGRGWDEDGRSKDVLMPSRFGARQLASGAVARALPHAFWRPPVSKARSARHREQFIFCQQLAARTFSSIAAVAFRILYRSSLPPASTTTPNYPSGCLCFYRPASYL